MQGIAFAVTVNDEIIYTGYFWPSFSSQSCGWVVIDPLSIGFGNSMRVNLGYPSQEFATGVTDNRNASQILDVFRRDHKLIE